MTDETPDENRTAPGTAREDRTAPETLGDLSHTNPFTGEVFGATQTYERGRIVAADGGEADSEPADSEAAADGGSTETAPEELQDVAHTPPGDAEGANGVYERGHEGREEHR